MIGLLAVAAAMRIVSVAPALTEDLYAIGAGRQVVGVDSFSDRPAAVRTLPRVGGFQTFSTERIRALNPDLVVGIRYQARALSDLRRAGVATRLFELNDVTEDLGAIETLGALSGHAAQAGALTAGIRRDLAALAARAAKKRRLSAIAVVGVAPIYVAGPGSFLDELLRLANLRNVAADLHVPWPEYSAERVLLDRPDVVVTSNAGIPLEGMPWSQLAAVRGGRVIRLADDDVMRPGPRLAAVLRVLLERVDRFR